MATLAPCRRTYGEQKCSLTTQASNVLETALGGPASVGCKSDRVMEVERTMLDIRAVEITRNCEGVSTSPTELLSQIPKGEQICTVPAPVRQIASQPSDGQ